MNCQFVAEKTTLSGELRSQDKDAFKRELRQMLAEAKTPSGIAYVWRTQRPMPRLKGASPIIYVGKTEYSLYARYNRYVDVDTDVFWDRYRHILSHFGNIHIDLYQSRAPARTENTFLYQYQCEHYEAPPLNTNRFRTSLREPVHSADTKEKT